MAGMASVNESVRYEPEESPPPLVALGAGFQAALVILAPVALTVVIVVRIAEESDSYLAWGVFAALLVSGATTVLQAARLGRIGAGHVLMMGTSGAFIAVCVAALVTAGPATMASLIVVSSLFQFAMAARLSLLRRIFTPVVSGTVIMLIAATVFPIIFGMLTDVPEGSSSTAAPIVTIATLVTVLVLVLRAPPKWRLWSPIIGIVVGCAVAAPFGLYDAQAILDAPWVGVPLGAWPGFDLSPGPEFWGLLPAFIIVTLVGAIETIGDGVAIQRVSRRKPQATDFRVVQGALNADGMGNLLSGLAGTLPNTTYSSSIALAEVTGIGARRVGVVIGVIIAAVAFLPKVAAVLIAIPSPVAAAYITVLLGLLFVQGMKIVIQDGVDHRKAAVAGVAFWVGTGFQNQWIFADRLGDGFLSVLLGNGMTSGALVAIIMMLFMELTSARRRRLAGGVGYREPAAVGRVPARHRGESRVERRLDRAACPCGRGDAVEPAGGGRRQAGRLGGAAAGGDRAGRPCRGRVGVRDGLGGREPGGPPCVHGRDAGYRGRAGDIVPAAAALRLVGAAPEVSRRGHRHGERRGVAGVGGAPRPIHPHPPRKRVDLSQGARWPKGTPCGCPCTRRGSCLRRNDGPLPRHAHTHAQRREGL